MPAFGAYAGGLNVRDRAFAQVFATLAFTAHMLGERRVYAVAGQALPAGLTISRNVRLRSPARFRAGG